MGDQKRSSQVQRPEKRGHIWPRGGCNLAAVLLKTSVARIRSKIIRVTFYEVIIQFRLLCDYRVTILRPKRAWPLISGQYREAAWCAMIMRADIILIHLKIILILLIILLTITLSFVLICGLHNLLGTTGNRCNEYDANRPWNWPKPCTLKPKYFCNCIWNW